MHSKSPGFMDEWPANTIVGNRLRDQDRRARASPPVSWVAGSSLPFAARLRERLKATIAFPHSHWFSR
jgi:hypothetical protein